MHSYLMNTICRTGIFIICAQVLVHLRPKGSYEKYLKMLVSAMILMQLFLPVSTFFTGEGERSLAARVAWFQKQLSQSMEQMEQKYSEGESILEQMTLEEVLQNTQDTTQTPDASPVQVAPVEKIEIHIQSGNIGQEGGRQDELGRE